MGGRGLGPGLGGRGRKRSVTEEGRAYGWGERLESEDRGRRGGQGGGE